MSILVDSFAWLELFQGSKKGEKVLRILKENIGQVYTSVLNLYEIKYRVVEIKDINTANEFIKTIESHTNILDVTKDIAMKASEIKLGRKKMGAVDCIVLASARINGLKILTDDPHFDDVEEAVKV